MPSLIPGWKQYGAILEAVGANTHNGHFKKEVLTTPTFWPNFTRLIPQGGQELQVKRNENPLSRLDEVNFRRLT